MHPPPSPCFRGQRTRRHRRRRRIHNIARAKGKLLLAFLVGHLDHSRERVGRQYLTESMLRTASAQLFVCCALLVTVMRSRTSCSAEHNLWAAANKQALGFAACRSCAATLSGAKQALRKTGNFLGTGSTGCCPRPKLGNAAPTLQQAHTAGHLERAGPGAWRAKWFPPRDHASRRWRARRRLLTLALRRTGQGIRASEFNLRSTSKTKTTSRHRLVAALWRGAPGTDAGSGTTTRAYDKSSAREDAA